MGNHREHLCGADNDRLHHSAPIAAHLGGMEGERGLDFFDKWEKMPNRDSLTYKWARVQHNTKQGWDVKYVDVVQTVFFLQGRFAVQFQPSET